MRDAIIFDLLKKMFQAFNLPWTELNMENMKEKVKLLGKVRKNQIKYMKRLTKPGDGTSGDAAPVVYKSKLEE